MGSTVLLYSIYSLILIGLIHYLYNYGIASFTTPKVKDYVNRPKKHYGEILEVINETPIVESSLSGNMKNELEQYLHQQLNNE